MFGFRSDWVHCCSEQINQDPIDIFWRIRKVMNYPLLSQTVKLWQNHLQKKEFGDNWEGLAKNAYNQKNPWHCQQQSEKSEGPYVIRAVLRWPAPAKEILFDRSWVKRHIRHVTHAKEHIFIYTPKQTNLEITCTQATQPQAEHWQYPTCCAQNYQTPSV